MSQETAARPPAGQVQDEVEHRPMYRQASYRPETFRQTDKHQMHRHLAVAWELVRHHLQGVSRDSADHVTGCLGEAVSSNGRAPEPVPGAAVTELRPFPSGPGRAAGPRLEGGGRSIVYSV